MSYLAPDGEADIAYVGEESQRYDGGLIAGPRPPSVPVTPPAAPDCQCRTRWWTLYAGRRWDRRHGDLCAACGGRLG